MLHTVLLSLSLLRAPRGATSTPQIASTKESSHTRNVPIELAAQGLVLHHYEGSLLPPSPLYPLPTKKAFALRRSARCPYRPRTIPLPKPSCSDLNRLNTEMYFSLLMPQITFKGHRSSGIRVPKPNWHSLPTASTRPERTASGQKRAFEAHVPCRPSPKRERHRKVNLK